MIQDIGINISATGAQAVASEFNQIATSMQNFQRSVNDFSASIKRLSGRTETLFTKASKLNDVGAHFSTFATRASTAVAGLSVEMGKLGTSITAIEKATRSSSGGGSGGGAAGGFLGGLFGGAMGPFGFMARFMAFHQALRGMQYGVTDILMGKSREEIAKANLDLAAVSANKEQRGMIEAQAHKFASKYGVVEAPEYINAAAQTASALEIQKLGAGTIGQITEQNVVGAKMTSMNQSAFAEAQSKIMSSYLSRFDAAVGQTLKSGGYATLPEFGRVNLQELHGKIVAMTAKVVEKTNIWGQGLMDFYSYAGSMAGEKGMPLADVFAMGGVLSDLGFKGAKSGRALKSILAGQAEPLANLLMIADNKYKMDMSKDEKKAFTEDRRSYAARINQLSESAEGQAQLSKMLAPGLAKAMMMSKDPNVALSLTKDLGISADFLPQVLALYKDSAAKMITDLTEQIRNATFGDTVSKFEDATKDAGWQTKKLSATWSGFVTSLTTTVNNMIGDVAEATGLTAALNRGKEFFDKQNADKKKREFVEGLDKRPTGGSGDYSEVSGEDIMKLQSPQTITESVNKWLRDQWLNRKGLAKTPEEKERLREQMLLEGNQLREQWFWGGQEEWDKGRNAKIDAMKDSGETIDELMPERFPMYGMPHDTGYTEYEFFKRNPHLNRLDPNRTSFDEQWYAKPKSKPPESILDYMKQESPQDQLFGQPPLHPELRSEQQNIEVKPDIKVAVYIDGREIHSEVRAIIDNEKFYNRSNYTGSVLS